MLISRVARRYAEAVYDSIPSEEAKDVVMRDVADLKASLLKSKELRRFFESPVIPLPKKAGVIDTMFSGRIDGFLLGVLQFLLHKRREALILQILEAMLETDRRKKGIIKADVATAVLLDEGRLQSLLSSLSVASGKRVEAEQSADPSLIGGLVVRVGDMVYDGSVRRSLERLRLKLISGAG